MNRVIKFRCWNPTGNCMHAWNELVEKNKIHLIAQNSGSYPVMQFTGLTDKNSVEIYEGDITEDKSLSKFAYESGEYARGVIVFHESAFLECYTHNDGQKYYEKIRNSVVVGNIHQHPELLK